MTIQMIHNFSDEQLVAHFQATKNNQFFSEIYNRYYKKVYHTCLGISKDREVSFDLVQDVMIKVMEKLPTLQNGFLLGLWIHRIAKNYSLDYCKNRNNWCMVNTDDRFDIVDEGTEIEEIEAKEKLLNGVARMMKELREEDSILLTLKYFDDYTIVDLQNKYSLSESAVKMRLARARNSMADIYHSKRLEEMYA